MGKGGFNWKGITDNGDGTFTAKTRIEKRRLLKNLHRSGYLVRSRKTTEGNWRVVAIGTRKKPQIRPATAGGYKPKTRYVKTDGRYIPIAPRRRGNYLGRIPKPVIYPVNHGSGSYRSRPQGPSLFENYMRHRKDRAVQREAERKQMLETDAKMKKERIEQETKAERKSTVKEIRKKEFERENAAHEHREAMRKRDEQAKREKEQHRPLYDNPANPRVIPRHVTTTNVPPRAARQTDPYIKPPHIEKTPKIDPNSLQYEREREIGGG